MKTRPATLLLTLTLLAGCAGSNDTTTGPTEFDKAQTAEAARLAAEKARLDTLAKWMSGSFDSAEQAKADKDYFVINLHMAPIWESRSDARWLYVEQAMSTQPSRPYRQRVYRLTSLGNGKFMSEVFELPGDPLLFAGGWNKPDLFVSLSPSELIAREGCAITLTDGGTAFTGATGATSCLSTLRGAAYATSEVVLGPDQLISWDRGFDKDGKQVWGAVKGGYIFKKTSSATPSR